MKRDKPSRARAPRRPDARRARRWSGPSIALAAASGALLVAFIALGAVHAIVSSRMLRSWVNDEPEKLLLEYESASSWVPGIVQVKGLSIRARDPNVEWYFRMDEARISISLFDLLRRRFHATDVRASGLIYRLRIRQEPKTFSRAHAALLPPIPGFPDPPMQGPEPPETPTGKLWTVQVDRIMADPTPDLWIELYRFRGHARVTGGFFLHPRVRASVGPASVEFLSGDLALGKETLLADASGRTDCSIAAFDPRRVRGNEVWPFISGGFHLKGRVPSVRFLDYFLRDSPEPRLDGGRGSGSADISVDRGLGRGRLDFGARGVTARYHDATLRGDAAVRGKIPRWDFEHDRIDLSGTVVDLTHVVSEGKRQDSRDWWGRFDLASAEVGNAFSAKVDASCRDARPLFRLFDVQLPGWTQALLKLEGFEAKAKIRLAPSLVDLRDLDASGGKFHIAGDYYARGKTRRGAFLVETGPLAVGIDIDGASSRLKLLGARAWFPEARRAEASARPAAQ